MLNIGDRYTNKFGEQFEIIKKTSSGYLIKFDNGVLKTTREKYILSKGVHSPYAKTLLGVGYLGEGKYNSKENKIVYKAWSHMHTRCYDKKYSDKYPTYQSCTVCEEWHNFQNFAEWWYNNEWGYDGVYFLDKDILNKNNKIYSPNNCVFVNNHINCLFTKCDSARGELPIGVSIDKRTNQYRAYIFNDTLKKRSMKYITDKNIDQEKAILMAFNIYKKSKEKVIKEVADYYKNKYPDFPQKLYDALYAYEVEITD